MNDTLLTQLRILKLSQLRPNFSDLAREYGMDRRTVKKYYDGYNGKPSHHQKPSKLDQYQNLIKQKLLIKGTTIRSVYEFLISEIDASIGTYSNFYKYVTGKKLVPKKSEKGHPRFETAPGHPYTKGKVETVNKFLDWLRPYEGTFETEADLIHILDKINNKVNTHVCQATNVPPLLLFQKEKEYLQPLPSRDIIASYLSHDQTIKVQKDSLITYKGNKYSVPAAYIGKSVWIKQIDYKLHIYYNTELIAIHTLINKKINYQKEHYMELLSPIIKDDDAVVHMAEANLRQMDELL